MDKRYIIYCDESDDSGQFYSNFYGGILIESSKRESLQQELQTLKNKLHIFDGEMKWERITKPYADKYIEFVNKIFDVLARGDMKIRIMFTQNRNRAVLKDYQTGNDYFMLYYQFIKHAFGLQHAVPSNGSASAALLLDDVPHNTQMLHQFKEYISNLSTNQKWRSARFSIAYEDVTDVNSKKHNILQALDIVLGGIQSRLNEKHTKPHPPAIRRGKRTKAKAKVYEAIKNRIFELYPNFNVGISTANPAGSRNTFEHAYRHWLFVPYNNQVDPRRTKKVMLKSR
jgi:hypothetical protein